MGVVVAIVPGGHYGDGVGRHIVNPVGGCRRVMLSGLPAVRLRGMGVGQVLVSVAVRERHRPRAESGHEGEHDGDESDGGRPGHPNKITRRGCSSPRSAPAGEPRHAADLATRAPKTERDLPP